MDNRLRSTLILWIEVALWLFFVGYLVWYAYKQNPDMFQRTRASMVAVGVLFFAIHGRNLTIWLIEERLGNSDANEIMNYRRTGNFVEFLFIIFGTLVWGYGDLFVCWLNDLPCNGLEV